MPRTTSLKGGNDEMATTVFLILQPLAIPSNQHNMMSEQSWSHCLAIIVYSTVLKPVPVPRSRPNLRSSAVPAMQKG